MSETLPGIQKKPIINVTDRTVKLWYACTSCGRKTNDMKDYMICPFCGGDLVDNE